MALQSLLKLYGKKLLKWKTLEHSVLHTRTWFFQKRNSSTIMKTLFGNLYF